MTDREGVGIQVDGVPLKAEDLAAAQSVEGRQLDGKFQRVALQNLKQCVDLRAVVEVADEGRLLWALDSVGWIEGNQVHLDSILERPVDDGVVVNDRVRVDPFELLGIKVLDIRRRQLFQRDAERLEVWDDDALSHRHIRGVGGQLDGAFGDGKPALEEVSKEHILTFIRLCR